MKYECPVCGKLSKSLTIHFAKIHKDIKHQKYIKNVCEKVDPLLSEMYLFEIQELFNDESFSFLLANSFLAKRRRSLGINGRKVVGKRREGDGNPVEVEGVREKISDTVRKLWESGSYDERINGMLEVCGPLSPNYKPELHTPTYLVEKNYVEFLGQFQDIKTCSRCGRNEVKINIHHIDERHENFLPSNLEPLCIPCHLQFHYERMKCNFITIGKSFTFDGAHFLPGHPKLCKYLHGHQWTLEVSVKKRIDRDTGMVMDFGDLKEIVKKHIIDELDHNLLNDILVMPTAENLIVWVWERLMFDGLLKGIEAIKLWETPSSCVTLDKEGMLSRFISAIEDYVPSEWRK